MVAGVAAKEAVVQVAGWQWHAGSGGISEIGVKLCGGSGDICAICGNIGVGYGGGDRGGKHGETGGFEEKEKRRVSVGWAVGVGAADAAAPAAVVEAVDPAIEPPRCHPQELTPLLLLLHLPPLLVLHGMSASLKHSTWH